VSGIRCEGNTMKPIPISAAKRIAEAYGYDQVVIIARKVNEGEHCTTYGVDRANCSVAAQIGDYLKFKVMGWAAARKEGET
jgi:hypothetical protein